MYAVVSKIVSTKRELTQVDDDTGSTDTEGVKPRSLLFLIVRQLIVTM
jgi:hypothetical protein